MFKMDPAAEELITSKIHVMINHEDPQRRLEVGKELLDVIRSVVANEAREELDRVVDRLSEAMKPHFDDKVLPEKASMITTYRVGVLIGELSAE